jgi:thymidylate synthase (FAD)
MILVKSSFRIISFLRGPAQNHNPTVEADWASPLQLIEQAGRTCYKSENRITTESSKKFVEFILKRGHESVIEHSAATVKIICDRGVTHELVRHRLAAYSQESTRYCNYKGGVTFVIPPWVYIPEGKYDFVPSTKGHVDFEWAGVMLKAEQAYIKLLEMGWPPQQARSVLPNSTKTEIVITANFREWRHIFRLCCSKAAHPQMREIMIPLLKKFQQLTPVIFDDIEVDDV